MAGYYIIYMKEDSEILQAEGELNRQIIAALNKFRTKLTRQPKDQESNPINTYDTAKEGPEKIFRFRESLLTLKFREEDYKTMYNMIAASLIVLMFRLVYDSYVTKGSIIDVMELRHFFRGWQKVFLSWWVLTLIHFSIIPIVFFSMKTSVYLWLPVYIMHQIVLMYYGISASQTKDLGFACIFIIMCQAIRMLMKSHSYFRTKLLYLKQNPYKYWHPKKTEVNMKKPGLNVDLQDFFGELRRFSYFFVCPSLIYRDHYTLTPIRSLSKILFHFVNFFACIYYAFILYVMLCKDTIEALENKLDFHTFLITILKLMLPSVFFLILGFFGFLHSWINLWSELTRFADRASYSDWWNSYEFGSYYRKWNIVVHDWLYYYIYLDLQRFFPFIQRNKIIAQLSTFFISAVIHEMIVCFALGFFYPILFILFTGPGILMIKSQQQLSSVSVNFIFWLQMYIGSSMMFGFYLVQIFARQNINDSIINEQFPHMGFLIPRTFYLGNS